MANTHMDDGDSLMNLRSTILAKFEEVAKSQQKSLGPLDDDLILLEDVYFPVTFGDWVRLYENAAS